MLRNLSRHDPFIAVSKQRIALNAALLEYFSHNGEGHLFSCSRGNSCLDQDKRFGLDELGDDLKGLLEGAHFHLTITHISQRVLGVVQLDVNDDHIGKLQTS